MAACTIPNAKVEPVPGFNLESSVAVSAFLFT
jgi:hypothetical protein